MTPKDLKKLAAACRAAGITTFKNSEVEFTLGDAPLRSYTKRTQKTEVGTVGPLTSENAFESDTLTDEQLLLWSAPGDTEQ